VDPGVLAKTRTNQGCGGCDECGPMEMVVVVVEEERRLFFVDGN